MGDRLPNNIFSRSQQSAPPARRRYELDSDSEGDRQQLSPRIHDDDIYSSSISSPDHDVEAQRPSPEMAERRRSRFVLPRWSRPTIPSFLSMGGRTDGARPRPRPSSSHYSGDADEEPKTPVFPTLGIPDMPSTRLHLPNLQRTWTRGSNGPPTRPVTAVREEGSFAGYVEGLREPLPAVPAQHGQATRRQGRRRNRLSDGTETPQPDRRRRRHRRHGSDRYRMLIDENEARRGQEGQEEAEVVRRHRRHRSDRSRRERKPHPKRFLFCLPWVKSKRARSHILRCFVSGMFLTLLLSVYLALSITRNINSSEFSVLLILVILFVAIFFCHGLIRLCMLMTKAGKNLHETEEAERARRLAFPQMVGPGGYAIPRQPIRVVLARDEEAAGLDSETTKISPPAYGLWRESVRVDPNRIFWARNEAAPATPSDESVPLERGEEPTSRRVDGGDATSEVQRPIVMRPPSYASDDGVSYVVEAQPRSIAPTTDVPIAQHPEQPGRPMRTARWC